MKRPKPVVIDFETDGIEGRPHYPPKPFGVAIKYPGKKAKYYGWGHDIKNNSTHEKASEALQAAWRHAGGLLFQNAKFDLDVAVVHMGMEMPPWERVHDTMFLLFLDDPHQVELGLKPSSERLLGVPPEEQDEVGEWLTKNQPLEGIRISMSPKSPHYFMRYLRHAPGDLVGKYCIGDVDRTEALFNLLWDKTAEREMLGAYDRERELMPILLEMEQQGLPVDHDRLRRDVDIYSSWSAKIDQWIFKTLKADINLDSGQQLVEAMVAAGKVDLTQLPMTDGGKYQTNKDALAQAVTDPVLLAVLTYRAQLHTCLRTFMIPWLRVADQSGGVIYTYWNQIKGAEGRGTRTGRLSSTPNFQNIPNVFDPIFSHEQKGLPKSPFRGLPPLPKVRSYIIPFPGHVIIDRDYCFGPETEVLTENGFVLFEDLDPDVKVAQWRNGEISYARPVERQKILFDGELVHIRGGRSTDLLVTPNHQCLLARDNQTFFARADEYPMGRHQQIHAGVVPGVFKVRYGVPRLLAAIQADATLKNGKTLAWMLKKQRKVERLHMLLNELAIPWRLTTPPSADGCSVTYVDIDTLPPEVERLLGSSFKDFSPMLRDLCAPQRLELLRELALWDGTRRSASNWIYCTTNVGNADLVQELAAITGLRAVAKELIRPSLKTLTFVSMRTNYLTWAHGFTRSRVPYKGFVHCVTMPQGTVIVRRGGRVMVTGQSQQEPRILAHFEGGALMDKYLDEPWIDFHDYAKDELAKRGRFYERKPVKNTNLGLIYGMGVGTLAEKNEMTVVESAELKKAILQLYPGLNDMYKDMKVRAKTGVPIRTWGGREYYCEPPKIVNGRVREFDYKLVNILIQGSAADCTKQAIINFHKAKRPEWKIMLNVHDQITASVPKDDESVAMETLREAMESVKFDVPILSEGAVSNTNWQELSDYDKRGVKL